MAIFGPEIATAYVRIRPTVQGFEATVERDIKKAGAKSGRTFGGLFKGTVAKLLAGGSALFAGFKFFQGGISRLIGLEEAEARLKGMGVNARQTAKLMDGLLSVLKGTAFSLDEGATTMAQLVSTGLGLKQVTPVMQLIADTAAFAKVPLQDIGFLFSDIQAVGRLTGDSLRSLQERGVPALDLLADAAGVSRGEMQKMVSAGEVSAEEFFRLWEKGSKGFGENGIVIAGAAKNMGDTTKGAFQNMLTAFNRLGANLFGAFFPKAKNVFNSLTTLLDNFGEAAVPAVEGFADFLFNDAVPAISSFGNTVSEFLAPAFEAIGPVFENIVDFLADFRGSLKTTEGRVGTFAAFMAEVWQKVSEIVVTAWEVISRVVELGVGLIVGIWQRSGPTIINSFKGIWGAIQKIFSGALDTILGILEIFAGILTLDWSRAWQGLQQVVGGVFKLIIGGLQLAFNNLKLVFSIALGIILSLWSGAWTKISNFLGPIFEGILNNIKGFLTGIRDAFDNALRVIGGWVESVRKALTTGWNVIIKFYQKALDFIVKLIDRAFGTQFKVIKFVLNEIWLIIKFIWNNVVKFVTSNLTVLLRFWTRTWKAISKFATDTWRSISKTVKTQFESVRKLIERVLKSIRTFWERIWKAVRDFLAKRWDDITRNTDKRISSLSDNLKKKLESIRKFWSDIWTKIRDKGRDIWDQVVAGARRMRDNLGGAFDSLKRRLGTPVNWVIDNVVNKLIGGWNRVNNIWGGSDVSTVSPIQFRTGGQVPGRGNRDTVPALLTPGEYVMRKDAVNRLGVQYLESLNSGREEQQQRTLMQRVINRIPRFQTGGLVGPIVQAAKLVQSLGYRILSGYRPGSRTRSGSLSYHARGMAIDVPPSMKLFNILRDTYPWATELIFTPAGIRQLWHGSPHIYSGGVASDHYSHIHLALATGLRRAVGTVVGLARKAIESLAKSQVGGILDSITGGITKLLPKFPGKGLLSGMAKGIFGKMSKGIRDKAIEKVKDFLFGGGGTGSTAGGGTLGNWVRQAMALTNTPASWFQPLLGLARHESGGNPRAINNWDINARRGDPSRGLFQTIGATFRAYSLPGLKDIYNPVHNAVAAIRYIKSRYGSIFRIPSYRGGNRFVGGYDAGGILPPGVTIAANNTGSNEVVAAQGMIFDEVMAALRQNGMNSGDTVMISVPGLGVVLEGFVDRRITKSQKQQVVRMRQR